MNNVIDLEGEIWRDIKGYEGLYMVSNKGRIKSLNYRCTGNESILKQYTPKEGYQFVCLSNNGKPTIKYIHRIVAEAFLPNIKKELNCIDHIDTDRTNNCVENLRWCSQKENCNNPLSKLHYRDAKGGKPIYCYDTDTVYQSANEAARTLNVNAGNVRQCCRGLRSQASGYHFCYSDELPDTTPLFL